MTARQSIIRLIEKSKIAFPAFTLIELMLVMAIMGLLGTISIGGFRAMRRGMEQRNVSRIMSTFMDAAYQRARIDLQPVVVYFWNETRREESDTESLIVVGRAVAVRRAGRISQVEGNYLIDEFGDLRNDHGTDEEGEEDDDQAEQSTTMRLYKMNGGESGKRSDNSILVNQTTANMSSKMTVAHMMTDSDWQQSHSGDSAQILAYGWYAPEGVSGWKAGTAYGFEFAEITLPNNYIFGSSYSDNTTTPISECDGVCIKLSDSSAPSYPQFHRVCVGEDGKLTAEPVEEN